MLLIILIVGYVAFYVFVAYAASRAITDMLNHVRPPPPKPPDEAAVKEAWIRDMLLRMEALCAQDADAKDRS